MEPCFVRFFFFGVGESVFFGGSKEVGATRSCMIEPLQGTLDQRIVIVIINTVQYIEYYVNVSNGQLTYWTFVKTAVFSPNQALMEKSAFHTGVSMQKSSQLLHQMNLQ